MRSRAPPVADAARRSTRSGRKNRASEQREDFFGHRKAARTAICRGVRHRESRCRDRNLNKQLFAQTAPPPLRGRGTGRGQMRLRLPWERICAQYGFGFFAPEKSKFVSSTASDRKGFVKGESVPLDRILVPFVRTKGTPRRRAVQIMPLQKAARRRKARRNYYLLPATPQSAIRLTAPLTQGSLLAGAMPLRYPLHKEALGCVAAIA